MSERNGDRARFQKNRKRKLRHRERIQKLASGQTAGAVTQAAPEKAGRR